MNPTHRLRLRCRRHNRQSFSGVCRNFYPLVTLSLLTSWAFIIHHSNAFMTLPHRRFYPSIQSEIFHQKRTFLCSSIGDGSGGDNSNNNKGKGSNDGNLDDFLDPLKAAQESENLKRARAALSEEALPINYNSLDKLEELEQEEEEGEDDRNKKLSQESAQTNATNGNQSSNARFGLVARTNNDATSSSLAKNPYLNVVAKLSPSELISRFTSTAHPRAQEAVRSTILGLIGTLPKMAFETTTITTGERLASLMFQLQMTGYMFKNAEYRLSLSQSLGLKTNINGSSSGKFFLGKSNIDGDDEEDDDDEDGRLSAGKVKGKIKVSYQRKRTDDQTKERNDDGMSQDSDSSAMEIEVDAAAYMAELRNEVSKLREDLISTRQAKEEAIRKDLLLYIRTLPQQELNKLTNTMTNDVLVAMKALVNVVMSGIGDGRIDRNTITEQSGEAMAQLCMWQLVVGYNLRELEVREEMKNALKSAGQDTNPSNAADSDDLEGSIDYEEGGFE
mmetsp:Transcript_428/g.717  ORF Transcript_428/g.717 Transcript_428/m.717 type:complete len:504 (+) Transcript_428:266-1777(+)